jgi:hypothetical protein
MEDQAIDLFYGPRDLPTVLPSYKFELEAREIVDQYNLGSILEVYTLKVSKVEAALKKRYVKDSTEGSNLYFLDGFQDLKAGAAIEEFNTWSQGDASDPDIAVVVDYLLSSPYYNPMIPYKNAGFLIQHVRWIVMHLFGPERVNPVKRAREDSSTVDDWASAQDVKALLHLRLELVQKDGMDFLRKRVKSFVEQNLNYARFFDYMKAVIDGNPEKYNRHNPPLGELKNDARQSPHYRESWFYRYVGTFWQRHTSKKRLFVSSDNEEYDAFREECPGVEATIDSMATALTRHAGMYAVHHFQGLEDCDIPNCMLFEHVKYSMIHHNPTKSKRISEFCEHLRRWISCMYQFLGKPIPDKSELPNELGEIAPLFNALMDEVRAVTCPVTDPPRTFFASVDYTAVLEFRPKRMKQ